MWVAAPAAAALLSDWGADVIKVEPPAGDPMRYVFGSLGVEGDLPNPAFALDNRGKRSVVLDLRDESGRRRLEELLASADVFISNLRPDALDRLDLTPEATVARHPHLVYCSVSGYGLRGEERDRPTYDIGAFWARSGLAVQMADADGSPLNARGGIGDHITALAALAGLLAAVIEQRADRPGPGGRGLPAAHRRLHPGLGPRSADGAGQGGRIGAAARQPGSAHEPLSGVRRSLVLLLRARGGTALCRPSAGPSVVRTSSTTHGSPPPRASADTAPRSSPSWTRSSRERPLEEWAECFDREGVWWAPAQSPAEVVGDPQLVDNEGFVEVSGGPGGPAVRSVNGPVSFSGVRPRPTTSVPALGEHTGRRARRGRCFGAVTGLASPSPGPSPGPGGPGR